MVNMLNHPDVLTNISVICSSNYYYNRNSNHSMQPAQNTQLIKANNNIWRKLKGRENVLEGGGGGRKLEARKLKARK